MTTTDATHSCMYARANANANHTNFHDGNVESVVEDEEEQMQQVNGECNGDGDDNNNNSYSNSNDNNNAAGNVDECKDENENENENDDESDDENEAEKEDKSEDDDDDDNEEDDVEPIRKKIRLEITRTTARTRTATAVQNKENNNDNDNNIGSEITTTTTTAMRDPDRSVLVYYMNPHHATSLLLKLSSDVFIYHLIPYLSDRSAIRCLRTCKQLYYSYTSQYRCKRIVSLRDLYKKRTVIDPSISRPIIVRGYLELDWMSSIAEWLGKAAVDSYHSSDYRNIHDLEFHSLEELISCEDAAGDDDESTMYPPNLRILEVNSEHCFWGLRRGMLSKKLDHLSVSCGGSGFTLYPRGLPKGLKSLDFGNVNQLRIDGWSLKLFPASLERLILNDLTNLSKARPTEQMDKKMSTPFLPALKYLDIKAPGNFPEPLLKGLLSPSLETLILGEDGDEFSFDLVNLPAALKRLTIRIIPITLRPNVLPSTLEFIEFAIITNEILTKDMFPAGLLELIIDEAPDSLQIESLPGSIQKLNVPTS